jgi:hypothetical protein
LPDYEIRIGRSANPAGILYGNISGAQILSAHYTVEGMMYWYVGDAVVVYALRKTD